MLNIQEFLLTPGNKPEDLKATRGINFYEHPTLPLMGFKYDQIDSPKTDPIVKEARGIVLEKDTWKLVAQPFQRFFNLGEDAENFKGFDWNDFTCYTKEDGSLMIVYFYAGQWHINTSGSFGLGEVNFSKKTWRELFWETFGKPVTVLDQFKHLTLIFELCTPYNEVVRTYLKPTVFLLGAFEPAFYEEKRPRMVDHLAEELNVPRPAKHEFKSETEIMAFLREMESKDETFEGVVIRDKGGMRAKVKSSTYLAIHHLMDNGNIFNPSRQVPLVLAGEAGEVSATLARKMGKCAVPTECKGDLCLPCKLRARFEQTKAEVEAEWEKLKAVWEATHTIADQKEFALKITKGDGGKPLTPFTGLLFSVRKEKGAAQTLADLKAMWRNSADMIVKRLYE